MSTWTNIFKWTLKHGLAKWAFWIKWSIYIYIRIYFCMEIKENKLANSTKFFYNVLYLNYLSFKSYFQKSFSEKNTYHPRWKFAKMKDRQFQERVLRRYILLWVKLIGNLVKSCNIAFLQAVISVVKPACGMWYHLIRITWIFFGWTFFSCWKRSSLVLWQQNLYVN